MKTSSQQKVMVAFSLGLIIIIFVTAGTYRTVTAYDQALKDVAQNDAVQKNLYNLLAELNNAETSERGYVITGDATYLQPFSSSVSSVNSTYATLYASLPADANLTSLYQRLQVAVVGEISTLRQTVAIRQAQGFPAAQAAIDASTGHEAIDQVRTLVNQMDDRLTVLQNQEVETTSQQGALRITLIFLDSLFAIGVITVAAYVIVRTVKNEQRARTEAQLLQDILTHDVRNYNQISLLNAELLNDRAKGDEGMKALSARIIRGVQNATKLVERGQDLGRIVSESPPRLLSIDLLQSIERSMQRVRATYPDKEVEETLGVPKQDGSEEVRVLADELLDEVFVNLFSNSVKFTEGRMVPIEVEVDGWPPDGGADGSLHGLRSYLSRFVGTLRSRPYWRITVRDHGRGISDEQKKILFQRLGPSQRVTGLGLYIVHTLVVGRYRGWIEARDGTPSPDGRGFTLVFYLRKG